jgi:hypothetical protein
MKSRPMAVPAARLGSRPANKNWPNGLPLPPPRLVAQQPTGGPPKQPARAARLGQNSAQQPPVAATVHSRPMRQNTIQRPPLLFGGIKGPVRPTPLENPRPFFLLPLSRSFSPTQAAAEAGWPAAGLRWRRQRSATRPRPPVAPLSSVLSLPPPFFPSPQKPRGQGVYRPQHPGGEDGGAAAGPLAGERVPHAGERAAVEGMHGGALWAQPAWR